MGNTTCVSLEKKRTMVERTRGWFTGGEDGTLAMRVKVMEGEEDIYGVKDQMVEEKRLRSEG